MKVSLNWLNKYITVDLSPEEIADKLTSLGLEATYQIHGKSFQDVVLGKVIECRQHDNADKLSVCEVDIGEKNNYTIVCGAPNIKSDIIVPVAKVGSLLQNGEFKIKKTKIRGVESNGMICSGKELGINNDHDGIMIIKSDAKLGTPFEEIIKLNNDVLFELDLTPNRGDCLSHRGVARELGAVLNKKIDYKSSLDNDFNCTINDTPKIQVDDSKTCPRYAARIIKDITVGPSPQWLQDKLEIVGLSSINNIVDAANFVLMDSGHPMHTFDFNKLNSNQIVVRFAKDKEKIITLDKVERKLEPHHLLICNDKTPIALAGIMGGLNSEISDETKDILIESAYFNPTIIRKGAKSLDISTDASRRFERDTDIESVISSLNQLTQLILETAGGKASKEIIDLYPNKKEKRYINFSTEKCNQFLGSSIDETKVINLFNNLHIETIIKDGLIECSIPSFRNDLEREVDLYEEVARIIGYDNIPSSTKFSGSYSSFVKDENFLDNKFRMHLKYNGYNEHYSNSLQHYDHTIQFNSGEPIEIKNPLSRDMGFLRNSILPGLLFAASYNEKRQNKGFNLFEIGAVHNLSTKSKTGTREQFHLGLLWYGLSQSHWRLFEERDLFRFKGEITKLLNSQGFKNIVFKLNSKELGFAYSLKIYIGKTQIGIVGLPDNMVLKLCQIKQKPIICDLNLKKLRELYLNIKVNYAAPSQYPGTVRDIALKVEKNISAEQLITTIKKNSSNKLLDISLFDIYQQDDIGDNNKSLAFSLHFQSESSTLTDDEVDMEVNKILHSLKDLHGAIQR